MKLFRILMAAVLIPAGVMAQPGRGVLDGGMLQRSRQPQATTINEQLQKLLVAESAISQLYVEEVDQEKLVEQAIKGMLKELDPHSTYLSPEENEKSNETLMGNFDGIGVQFNMVDDTLFVVQPLPDGPSEKAGIMAGDRIVTVNDTAIAGVGMSDQAIMKKLRGPKGTKVRLGISRRGVEELIPFTITRDKIPVNTIDATFMVRPGIGYVRISNFGATTVQEFETAFDELKKKGATSFILDLQGNGGGLLMAAVGLANEFMNRDQMIVYTEGLRSPRSGYKADGSGKFKTGQLVVLIDEYSASASEIVTGALQDWDRATVIGRRSYGKGLVQRPVEFHDGSLIRLTIAKYYTPVGRCIQKPYGKDVDYADDINERFNRGELVSRDSIHLPDSLKFSTKIKGRTVYGGGGIMPDIFVPLDTTRTTPYYRKVSAKNVVLNTTIEYVEKNHRQLQRRYKNFEDYESGFEVGKDILSLMLDKCKAEGIEYDDEQYQKTLPIFQLQLKALIARNLWSMNEYYRIMLQLDNTLKRAVQYIESGE